VSQRQPTGLQEGDPLIEPGPGDQDYRAWRRRFGMRQQRTWRSVLGVAVRGLGACSARSRLSRGIRTIHRRREWNLVLSQNFAEAVYFTNGRHDRDDGFPPREAGPQIFNEALDGAVELGRRLSAQCEFEHRYAG